RTLQRPRVRVPRQRRVLLDRRTGDRPHRHLAAGPGLADLHATASRSGMNRPGAVLAVSPHPDDEILGAGATLMALRDAGWRVVNLACSLGRAVDRERRRQELAEACRRARFELVLADPAPAIGADDDLALAQGELARAVADLDQRTGSRLIVGPSPHDGHHGHEVVGRAIRDAVEARSEPCRVMVWGLWGDLGLPN